MTTPPAYGEADGTPEEPKRVPWPVVPLLVATAIVVVLALYAWLRFPAVPDPMPTHWGIGGEPDAWEPKSLPGFLTLVLLGPVIVWVTTLGTVALMRAMLGGGGFGVGMSDRDKARQRLALPGQLRVIAWMMVGILLGITVPALNATGDSPFGRFDMTVSMLVIAVAMVGLGVGLYRVQQQVDAELPPDPDAKGHAKWGMFWYEPDGPAMYCPPGGSNWVPNLATRGGKVAAVLLLGAPLVVILGLAVWSGIAAATQ